MNLDATSTESTDDGVEESAYTDAAEDRAFVRPPRACSALQQLLLLLLHHPLVFVVIATHYCGLPITALITTHSDVHVIVLTSTHCLIHDCF